MLMGQMQHTYKLWIQCWIFVFKENAILQLLLDYIQ